MPKPRTAAGYEHAQVDRVRATCLYVATKLGDLLDELVVVGGLVPTLLIDQAHPATEKHVGTMDLDVGMTPLVTRVLLRVNRRFYDGDTAHVKNMFQCVPGDARPDHFVRLAILRFLDARRRKKGPSGLPGYHRCTTLIQHLVAAGHAAERVRLEMLYLLKALCIVAEHQRVESLEDDDLVAIASPGAVHLEILSSIDYLAACAEDTYFDDQDAAQRIAGRIGAGRGGHFSEATIIDNAHDLARYLEAATEKGPRAADRFLTENVLEDLHDLRDMMGAVARARSQRAVLRARGRLFVANLYFETTEQQLAELFDKAGFAVIDIHMPHEPEGISKGVAFVTLKNPDQIDDAIVKTNGSRLGGRAIRVELARARPTAPTQQ